MKLLQKSLKFEMCFSITDNFIEPNEVQNFV